MTATATGTCLYQAPWVVPMAEPPIRDGGVLVAHGRIVAVGPSRRLRRDADTTVDCSGALLPPLVNSHIHLELSHLHGVAEAFRLHGEPGDLPDWIRTLLACRDRDSAQQQHSALADAIKGQQNDGVGWVLDIGNTSLVADSAAPAGLHIIPLIELLGFSEQGADIGIRRMAAADRATRFCGHAPYSTHPRLLVAIKDRCRQQKGIFSIHTAESSDEIELLQSGGGRFATFLRERGVLDDHFTAPGKGAVGYLDALGLLDSDTLCVHCVHVTDAELDILQSRGVGISLCPSSNRAIGVGIAPLEKMLARGMLPSVGTDSAASNPGLSLWREMRLLAQEHPGVAPRQILAMATLGGARALALERQGGVLAPGRPDRLLEVAVPPTNAASELFAALVVEGEKVAKRLHCGGCS